MRDVVSAAVSDDGAIGRTGPVLKKRVLPITQKRAGGSSGLGFDRAAAAPRRRNREIRPSAAIGTRSLSSRH